jgi:hypothetical protein
VIEQTWEETTMRIPTRIYVANLPARKRATAIMLLLVMCGGVVAGSAL